MLRAVQSIALAIGAFVFVVRMQGPAVGGTFALARCADGDVPQTQRIASPVDHHVCVCLYGQTGRCDYRLPHSAAGACTTARMRCTALPSTSHNVSTG